jgi:hypothetical protein
MGVALVRKTTKIAFFALRWPRSPHKIEIYSEVYEANSLLYGSTEFFNDQRIKTALTTELQWKFREAEKSGSLADIGLDAGAPPHG